MKRDTADYVLDKAVYQQPVVAYEPEKEKLVLLKLPGSVRVETNPDYEKADDKTDIPARIYMQEVHHFMVRSITREAIVKAGFSFTLSSAAGNVEVKLNLNGGIQRQFIMQEIVPEKSKVEIQRLAGKPDKEFPSKPQPELQKDSGLSQEQLQKIAEAELAGQVKYWLFYHLASDALDLYEKAVKRQEDKKMLEAADSFGRCMHYFSTIDPEKLLKSDYCNLEKAGDLNQKIARNNLQVVESIKVAKNKIWPTAISLIVDYLEK